MSINGLNSNIKYSFNLSPNLVDKVVKIGKKSRDAIFLILAANVILIFGNIIQRNKLVIGLISNLLEKNSGVFEFEIDQNSSFKSFLKWIKKSVENGSYLVSREEVDIILMQDGIQVDLEDEKSKVAVNFIISSERITIEFFVHEKFEEICSFDMCKFETYFNSLADYALSYSDKPICEINDNVELLLRQIENMHPILRSLETVLLKRGGLSEKHLFFVHDSTSSVEGYIELVSHVNSNINCWGIQCSGYENIEPFNLTFEDISNTYVSEIKKIQRNGPYHLVGWSIGGTLAFEIGRRLEANGDEVKFICLIDAIPPNEENEKIPYFTIASEEEKLAEELAKVLGDKAPEVKFNTKMSLFEFYDNAIQYFEIGCNEKYKTQILEYFKSLKVIPEHSNKTLKKAFSIYNKVRSYSRSRDNYVPQSFVKSKLYLFKASESPRVIKEKWEKYCKNTVKCKEFDGDHHSILEGCQASQMAKILDEIINENI